MRMEQNFGPHIEQKCATLWPSFGSVASWKAQAVRVEREVNWSCQRKSKRARDSASSRARAPGALASRSVSGDLVGK